METQDTKETKNIHASNVGLDALQVNPDFSEINALRMIQAQTNPAWVKSRKSGKMSLSYVSGDTVTRMLNKAFRYKWSFEVLETRVVESIDKSYKGGTPQPQNPVIQSLGRLTVPGWGEREQRGSQPLSGGADVQEHAFKSSATDAMKKCASMFGIALDLYGVDGANELMVSPADFLMDDDEYFESLVKGKDVPAEEAPAQKTDRPPAEPDLMQNDEPEDTPAPTPAPVAPVAPTSMTDTERMQVMEESTASMEPQTQTQSAPAPTPAPEAKPAPASYWKPEDIEGLKNEKARLLITNNEDLNPYTQEFFGNDTVTFRNITPANVKDFLHFLSTK